MIVVVIVSSIIILFVIRQYNQLVRGHNLVKNAFAQIDVQLNRRYDLIPNLVETAKGYMKHERETLDAVIRARNQALQSEKIAAADPLNPQKIKELVQAEGVLTRSLGGLFALVEQYPDLKANTTMNQLMEELVSTENKIAFARQGYNDSVMEYNNLRETFPNSLIANLFNFSAAQMLQIDAPEKREPIRVQF